MSFGKAKKHNNKIHIGSRAFDVFLIVFMIIVSLIFLYPFLNVIATSLSSNRMITTTARLPSSQRNFIWTDTRPYSRMRIFWELTGTRL